MNRRKLSVSERRRSREVTISAQRDWNSVDKIKDAECHVCGGADNDVEHAKRFVTGRLELETSLDFDYVLDSTQVGIIVKYIEKAERLSREIPPS